jgi:hypothetical protein
MKDAEIQPTGGPVDARQHAKRVRLIAFLWMMADLITDWKGRY